VNRQGRTVFRLSPRPWLPAHAYNWLYGTWLAQSGEEPADAPCVEEYLNDARTVPAAHFRTEIWLPLR